MKVTKTNHPDVLILEPQVFEDSRGFFMETYRSEYFERLGINADFVQDNHSRSCRNTLRGLHYQLIYPQAKLVRVVSGKIFDIAVDLRKSSPLFGQWVGVYLSEENKRMLWIPEGFAHGFFVVSDWADMIYKTTAYYSPENDRSIIWNDPDIGIDWQIPEGESPMISKKDSTAKMFNEAELYE